ncbi:hypothetical protein L9F63_004904 [Diploptera punctata]|uniref:CHK kinase-like domain-containing protein n=1 Tax=Diploptera punctata TaxID=6984 RepID=A0AAD8E6A9_DIPPU|nr:hypothetical protein L9F63_004904 [Diploptera punctata]
MDRRHFEYFTFYELIYFIFTKSVNLLQVTEKANLFQREIDVFACANNKIANILEGCGHGRYQPYGPKCSYTHSGPPASLIIMEDLKESGFRLAKYSEGLDINHCLLAVNALAIHHAGSVALFAKDPKKIEPFKKSIYTEEMKRNVKKLHEPTLRRIAFEAQTWPECQGQIADKIQELTLFYSFERLLNSVNTDDTDFNVLAHEDLCLDNLMFRYSDNNQKPADVRFVDFQLSHWTSPVLDLSYLINANASVDIVLQPEIILEEYYKTLRETLRALGCSHLCPSNVYLYDQYDKKCIFGIILGLVVRGHMLKDRTKTDKAPRDFRRVTSSHFSDSFRNDLKKMLPYYFKKGWLNNTRKSI